MIKHYRINVHAYNMTEEQLDSLFDRIAEAAHELDEELFCAGYPCEEEDCHDDQDD